MYAHSFAMFFKTRKREKFQPFILISIKTPLWSGCGFMQTPYYSLLYWFTNVSDFERLLLL
jgi:hypothetical protein